MTLLYSFHPVADEQQNEIWTYTCKKWGPEQADKYIDGLHTALNKIARDFSLLRNIPANIASGVKFFHYGRHYIFVQIAAEHLPESIQVLTILHDSMDIPVRLHEELERLYYIPS